jgi:3',5'-cyclic AMP phosphodiesterase CpdA
VLTVLHISDLHFGPHYLPRVGEALLRASFQLEPDIIVNTGDFTHRSKPDQFQQAWRFMARLPDVPTVVVPGNHDVPLWRVFERLFAPYRLYRQHISPDLDCVLRHERAVIVGLNTVSPLRAITNGRIGKRQLEFCARAFRDVPDGVSRIVAVHHHLAPAPDYEGGQVMPHSKRALDRFKDLRVDMILGGHLHRAYIGNSLDVYPGRDRDHGVIIVQSGTSTSRRGRAREREKNSLNLVRISDGVVRVMHYMYFDELDSFAPVSRHHFPRPGHDYLIDIALGKEEAEATPAPPSTGRLRLPRQSKAGA